MTVSARTQARNMPQRVMQSASCSPPRPNRKPQPAARRAALRMPHVVGCPLHDECCMHVMHAVCMLSRFARASRAPFVHLRNTHSRPYACVRARARTARTATRCTQVEAVRHVFRATTEEQRASHEVLSRSFPCRLVSGIATAAGPADSCPTSKEHAEGRDHSPTAKRDGAKRGQLLSASTQVHQLAAVVLSLHTLLEAQRPFADELSQVGSRPL
jgi:hypothetical protein